MDNDNLIVIVFGAMIVTLIVAMATVAIFT